MVSPEVIVTEKFFRLLVPETIVYQYEFVPIFDQKTSGRQVYHVVVISGVGLVPNGFGHHAEHGPTIQLEITGLYGINRHLENKWHAK